ncbi:MAG: hypothetical protein H6Q89_5528, partial [Myxococcaceae bacterium]|nr:hypothetical protein [Myxococcaceae bacterium]
RLADEEKLTHSVVLTGLPLRVFSREASPLGECAGRLPGEPPRKDSSRLELPERGGPR